MRIEHCDYAAVQFDFYIPESIWSEARTQKFIETIQSVEQGGTIFKGLTGMWQGDQESTRIYRVTIPCDGMGRAILRAALHAEIETLLRSLALSPSTMQTALLFTETEIYVSLSSVRE